MSRINATELTITNDPYISGRIVRSKYDPIFEQIEVGQRIVCPQGTAARLAVQFRKWLASHGYSDVEVKARERCADGQGGVWFLAGEIKPQTRWNTAGNKAPQLKRAA